MSKEITTVREYFLRLAIAFHGTDPAVAQDATYDAQEFLAGEREALGIGRDDPAHEADLVARLRENFGEPQEVVESYSATEAQVAAALAQPRQKVASSALGRILGVFVDPHSYGALFFMLLSLPLGVLYFTWAVTGVSLSLGLSILIFGFVFFLFFMSTVRAVALVECRVVEALLGERMPRRPFMVPPQGNWIERVKFWVKDKRTWLTILYMVLRLPLGIVYFVVTVTFLSFAFAFIAAPFAQLLFDLPLIQVFERSYYLPFAAFPLFWLAGILDLLLLMHVARAFGRFHARIAKAMLASPGA